MEFRGLCLVGFDCDAYPTGPSTTQLAAMAKQIAATLPTWRGHVKKRLAEEKLDAFAMHFLFVPFPSADGFRQLLRDKLGVAKPVSPAAPAPAPAPVPAAPTNAPAGTPPVAPAKPGRARRASAPPGVTTAQEPRVKKPRGTPSGAA